MALRLPKRRRTFGKGVRPFGGTASRAPTTHITRQRPKIRIPRGVKIPRAIRRVIHAGRPKIAIPRGMKIPRLGLIRKAPRRYRYRPGM